MDFKFLKKDNLPYIIIVALLLIIGYHYYDSHNEDEDAKDFLKINTAGIVDNNKKSLESSSSDLAIEKAPEEKEEIMVHISGAVNKPGILRLDSSKRVVDALDLAGEMCIRDSPWPSLRIPSRRWSVDTVFSPISLDTSKASSKILLVLGV